MEGIAAYLDRAGLSSTASPTANDKRKARQAKLDSANLTISDKRQKTLGGLTLDLSNRGIDTNPITTIMPESRSSSIEHEAFGQGSVELSHTEREKIPEWLNDEKHELRRGYSNILAKNSRYGRRLNGKANFGDMLDEPDQSKIELKVTVGVSPVHSNNSPSGEGDSSSVNMSTGAYMSQQQHAPNLSYARTPASSAAQASSSLLVDYGSSSDNDAEQRSRARSRSSDTQMVDWYDFDFRDLSYDDDVTYTGLRSAMPTDAEDASPTDGFKSAKYQLSDREAIGNFECVDQSMATFVTPPAPTQSQPPAHVHAIRGYSSASSTTMTASTYRGTPASTEPDSGRATPDDTIDQLGKLPAELRLRIFSYVFLGGASHVPRVPSSNNLNGRNHLTAIEQIDQDRFRPRCTSSQAWVPRNTPGNIGILGTCKQYHDEAAAILYGQHVFSKSPASFAWVCREDKAIRSIFPFAKGYLPHLRRVEVWVQETHGKSRSSEGTATFLSGLARHGTHLVKLTVFFSENKADRKQRNEQPRHRWEGEEVVVTGTMTLKHPVIKRLVNLLARNHVKNVEMFIEGEMMMGKGVLTTIHKAWFDSSPEQDRTFTVKAQHESVHLRPLEWFVLDDLAECELLHDRKVETRVKARKV